MAAGIATLQTLDADPPYDRLDATTGTLQQGLTDALSAAGISVCSNRVGSMLTLFFGPGPVFDYDSSKLSDLDRFARFHRAMLQRGVYLPPSQFEAVMVSAAHTQDDMQFAIDAAKDAAESVAG
jgi:glutamate-1-semialdehyde 2,1-aminomutase